MHLIHNRLIWPIKWILEQRPITANIGSMLVTREWQEVMDLDTERWRLSDRKNLWFDWTDLSCGEEKGAAPLRIRQRWKERLSKGVVISELKQNRSWKWIWQIWQAWQVNMVWWHRVDHHEKVREKKDPIRWSRWLISEIQEQTWSQFHISQRKQSKRRPSRRKSGWDIASDKTNRRNVRTDFRDVPNWFQERRSTPFKSRSGWSRGGYFEYEKIL